MILITAAYGNQGQLLGRSCSRLTSWFEPASERKRLPSTYVAWASTR